MRKPNIAIVRGKFLNKYEMQFYEPLVNKYNICAFGSKTPYHDNYNFKTEKLYSPMDLPDFPFKMQILNRIFGDAHVLFGLENKLRDFDLVHTAESYYYYTQQALNAKKQGLVKKVIVTILENIPFNNEGIRRRKEYKNRVKNEVDYIIALTNLTKEALITEGYDENKIEVINHFIDVEKFCPTKLEFEKRFIKGRKLTILFVGRLEEYKGILVFLDIAKKIIESKKIIRNIRFRIVGNGSLHNKVQEFISSYNLSEFITLENVEYNKMPEIYKSSDIFFFPARSTKTYIEQYCTALMEAQASALSILTTNVGGICENIADAGVVVGQNDQNVMFDNICEIIMNDKLRYDLSNKALNRAKNIHDIKFGAKKISNLWQKVLNLN